MLGVFLVVFGALFMYVRSIPVTYQSTSVVAFQPQPNSATGRDLISLLIQTYPEYVASGDTVKKAATAAGVPASEVSAGLNAEIPPLTLNMIITTELSDPGRARIANQSLVDQVIQQGKRDPYLVATPVSNASLDSSPAGVSKSLLLMVSFVLSGGLAVVAGIVLARWRLRRKGEERG